jgi:hypothetical protein
MHRYTRCNQQSTLQDTSATENAIEKVRGYKRQTVGIPNRRVNDEAQGVPRAISSMKKQRGKPVLPSQVN